MCACMFVCACARVGIQVFARARVYVFACACVRARVCARGLVRISASRKLQSPPRNLGQNTRPVQYGRYRHLYSNRALH